MAFVQQYLPIVGSTAAVYAFIVVALRLFGKTEVAQLSLVDLVFILLISNAVQNAMVGSDSTLTGGLVAATTLFVMNYLFKRCLYRTMLTRDELMESMREHGVERIADVDMAVLEVDGNISVLADQFKAPTRKARSPRRSTKKRQ